MWLITVLIAPDFPGDLLGLVAGLMVFLSVGIFTQQLDPPRPLRNGEGEEVEFGDRLGVLPLFRAAD